VRNAIKKQKFLSNQMALDLSIVGIVIRNVNQGDIKIKFLESIGFY
jgi:hypothetical protein